MVSERSAGVPVPAAGPVTLACGLALIPVLVRALLMATPELADGISHYQFARYAPQHPALLLDLWAKPLFTFLGMPFAQAGPIGLVVMNALLMAVTAWPLMHLVRAFASWAPWLVGPLLVLSPEYLGTAVAGMTEVLFGALAAWVLWCVWQERITAALILASLMPFSRPEWVGFLPPLVLWMLWQGRWRQLPWLGTAILIIGVIGAVVRRDPLWLIHEHPYQHDITYYGQGSFWHFVLQAPRILGWPLLVTALAALPVLSLNVRADAARRWEVRLILALGVLPTLLIFFAHSWVWWRGTNGSYGLLRVLATTVPLLIPTAVAGMALIVRTWRSSWARRLVGAAGLLVAAIGLQHLVVRPPWPIRPSEAERAIQRMAAGAQAAGVADRRIATAHPFAAHATDHDPFDSTRTRLFWRLRPERADMGLNEGDLVLWESELGPTDGGLPLMRLMEQDVFKVLGGWNEQHPERFYAGAEPYEAWLFERTACTRTVTVDTLIALDGPRRSPEPLMGVLMPCPDGGPGPCITEEYSLSFEDPLGEGSAVLNELVLEGELRLPEGSTGPVMLVFRETDGQGTTVRYHQSDLQDGPFSIRLRAPSRGPEMGGALFWWNPSKAPFALPRFHALRIRHTQR